MTSLGEWALKYLDYSENRHTQKTFREEKKPAFKRLFARIDLGHNDSVERLTPDQAAKHIQNLVGPYEGSTANKDRKNLSAAWNWGVKLLNMPYLNPFSVVDKQKQNKKDRYVPPLCDFWSVYDVAYCEQDKRLLLVYFHTAARKDELFRLKWKDIDFINRKVRLWSRKNRSGEWVGKWIPMSSDCEMTMRAQFKLTGKKKFVFIDEQSGLPWEYRKDFLTRLCEFAGVEYFDYHSIRHLTAVTLYKAGVSLADIQVILRHEKATTTDIYLKSLLNENEEGQKALESLPGPAERSVLKPKGPIKGPIRLPAISRVTTK